MQKMELGEKLCQFKFKLRDTLNLNWDARLPHGSGLSLSCSLFARTMMARIMMKLILLESGTFYLKFLKLIYTFSKR